MVDTTFEGVPPRMGGADVASAPPPGPSNHRVDYRGGAGPVFRIALVNSLLSLLTLGIYRFWARTRLRRYFWSHVELDGDPIEYTGTGKQLFLGFLIVLAILVPLLFGVDYLAAFFPEDAWQRGVIILIQVLVFLFLVQYAVFRARRYRLRHTRWRGIRCNQTGSGRRYALRAFGYLMLTLLTLGLAYPLFSVKTQRYLMNNTHLGNQAFSFDGRAAPLFRKWLPAWIIAISAGLFGTLTATYRFRGWDGSEHVFYGPLHPFPGSGYIAIAGLAAALLLYVWYRSREFRYFASTTRFGPLGFVSELKARSLLKIYGIYYAIFGVLILLVAAASMMFFLVMSGGITSETGELSAQDLKGQLDAAAIIVVVVAFLIVSSVLSVLNPILITHPLAIRVIGTLSLKGQYNMDELLQGAKTAERPGEGLADALDVDVAGF